MPQNRQDRWTVARLDTWYDPVMEARLHEEGDIVLQPCHRADPAAALMVLRGADLYQVSSTRSDVPAALRPDGTLLRQCPRLLCISTSGAGFDTVDVDACTTAGVLVVNQAGLNADAVAEHTLAVLLALTRRIVEADRLLHLRRGFDREDLMGHSLAGRVLGVVGIGHVGTRVAALARMLGMEVIACDPYLDTAEIARRGAVRRSLDELLAEADCVSLHCPLTPETRGMIGAAALARMRPGSLFVSTARGGIHDERALAAVLESGHLAGAAVDVWEPEPPPLDHPLLRCERLIATWHSAGVTHEARRRIAREAAGQIITLLRGAPPPRMVNPSAWERFHERLEARSHAAAANHDRS